MHDDPTIISNNKDDRDLLSCVFFATVNSQLARVFLRLNCCSEDVQDDVQLAGLLPWEEQ
jgi:hypothetical protein